MDLHQIFMSCPLYYPLVIVICTSKIPDMVPINEPGSSRAELEYLRLLLSKLEFQRPLWSKS